ncbi:MAG: hypothetical protein M3066_03605 [Actinomycetota bacterium]|nr:hypothetical protein [Actinomycetota bacterium]
MAAVVLVITVMTACGMPPSSNHCTQADLDLPTSATMPTPVAVKETRQLNKGERLDPLPPDVKPVPAEQAWERLLLHSNRPSNGGGSDELLLGAFNGTPAWVLFSSHLAQHVNPLAPTPGVKPRADAAPCVFVDVVTVLDARTAEEFHFSTNTSAKS